MLGTINKIGESVQSNFNAGYLTDIYLIRVQDTLFMSEADGISMMQQFSSIDIHPDAEITQLRIRPKTATLTESKNDSPDGSSFSLAISIPLKGPAVSLTNWILRNEKRRFITIARDTSGLCYIAGKIENGARIGWGRQIAATNVQLLTISLVDWHPIQFLPSIDFAEIFPGGSFDNSFDLSFS